MCRSKWADRRDRFERVRSSPCSRPTYDRRVCAVDAVLPARLPEDFVAAEERQIQTCREIGFDVVAQWTGPIFVVTNRDIDLVVHNQAGVPDAVHVCEVGDIVAILFKPSDHGIFVTEYPGCGFKGSRIVRPVIAHLVRTIGIGPVSSARPRHKGCGHPKLRSCRPSRYRLPTLRPKFGTAFSMAVIVPHHENNVAASSRVRADEVCEVNTGRSIGWYCPGRRHSPVAAIIKKCRRVGFTGWLCLRQSYRRGNRGDQPRAISRVIAHAVDIQAIRLRGSFHLERYRASLRNADVRGESLNGRVAGVMGADIPLARGISGLRVLAHDVICLRRAASESCRCLRLGWTSREKAHGQNDCEGQHRQSASCGTDRE